jgi:ATP-binding cassette subfamily C (CFTR/MRP) protein 1
MFILNRFINFSLININQKYFFKKFYGWELSFEKIVNKIRTDEMKYFKRYAMVGIITSFTWASAPFFVAAVSYTTFVLINKENNLDPSTAFVTLTLFYLIRFPLALLPQTITFVVQAYVAIKRIKAFLLLDETIENDVQRDASSISHDLAISVRNANMGWDKQTAFLTNLNFDVKKNRLIAVVGGVGSGKSSFLSALLGEMHKLNYGKISVNGKTAYVPQQAWIQNATIRENILFGNKYERDVYRKVIQACSLIPDFNIMPHGDSTEIGEKGINLSGGQKQRISLARSIYANADIYMLDDPLSAVDSHVGKHIFDHVIGPNGMLKNKTRLFVTNSLSFLPQVDQIIMLENGTICEIGAYEELKDKDGPFAEFIKIFLSNNKENPDDTLDDTISDLNSSIPSLHRINKATGSSAHGSSLRKRDSMSSSKYEMEYMSNSKLNGNDNISNHDERLIEKDEVESGTVINLKTFILFLELNLDKKIWFY